MVIQSYAMLSRSILKHVIDRLKFTCWAVLAGHMDAGSFLLSCLL